MVRRQATNPRPVQRNAGRPINSRPVQRSAGRWGWLDSARGRVGVTSPHSLQIARYLSDIGLFSRHVIGRPLRPYQLEPARAILHSVVHGQGLTFTVMMSRQAGKNELSAQLEALLLLRFQRVH